jgi:hypothetical protein
MMNQNNDSSDSKSVQQKADTTSLRDDQDGAESENLPNFVTNSCISERFGQYNKFEESRDDTGNGGDNIIQIMNQMKLQGSNDQFDRIVDIIKNWQQA